MQLLIHILSLFVARNGTFIVNWMINMRMSTTDSEPMFVDVKIFYVIQLQGKWFSACMYVCFTAVCHRAIMAVQLVKPSKQQKQKLRNWRWKTWLCKTWSRRWLGCKLIAVLIDHIYFTYTQISATSVSCLFHYIFCNKATWKEGRKDNKGTKEWFFYTITQPLLYPAQKYEIELCMHTRTHEHTHVHTRVHTCMHTHIPTATHPQGRRERNVWVCILNVCRIISL